MKTSILALGAALLLSGCLSSGPVPANSVFTDVQRDGSTITGLYNQAGFSSSEVQRLVSNVCTRPGISGYGEAAADSQGQVAFQFTCVNGNSYGASAGINFTRTGSNSATLSAVYSQDGNLSSASGDVRF
ncbi:MAG: hypothetical protein ACSHWY_14100 [Octadecabacter sp.]